MVKEEAAGMAIDVHAHHIPSSVVQQIKEGSDCGVEIAQWGPEGPQPRFGRGGAPSPPIIKELIDLEYKKNRLREQNLHRQVLSTSLDTGGCNLLLEHGCGSRRWLDRALAQELKR